MKSVRLKTNKFGESPWIYRKMVEGPAGDPAAANGELVEIFDPESRFVGYGFYNGASQIALRILHRGAKRKMEADFFREKIREAVYLRHKVLHLENRSDAYRVIHSEGDGLPGLIVDRFANFLVMEFHSLGFYRRAEEISEILRELFRDCTVISKVDPRIEKLEGFRSELSSPSAETVISENGIRFHIPFGTAHKTGFFCDQRDNRQILSQFCENKNVLDGCCYTGGFSLYAKILGKAGKVVGVDLDEKAIAVAVKNAQLNRAQIDFVHANLFDYLRKQKAAKSHWDVVVLDPPKLAPTKDDVLKAETAYKDLNELAMSVVKNGGLLLTCSCSGLISQEMFLYILKKAAARAERKLQILKIAGAAPDHPIIPSFPESEYLKAVFCSVRDK